MYKTKYRDHIFATVPSLVSGYHQEQAIAADISSFNQGWAHGNPGPHSHPATPKKVQAASKVGREGGQKPQGTVGQPQRAQSQHWDAAQDGYETINRYQHLKAKNHGAETLNQACCLSSPPPPPAPPVIFSGKAV